MRAADLIAKSLEDHGVKRAYCVPGESYLALLDALYESPVEVVICRHEGGAGFMACGEARLTGHPAVFMVSRGPGATNGSIALHLAEQDALPVICLIGQVAREERGRGVFQEMDYGHFFGSVCKGVFEVADAAKLGETVARAFHLAQEGVPGPVVISLPEDMLLDEAPGPAPAPYPVHRPQAGPADAEALQALIDAAERPVVIAGAALRSARGTAALARFAEAQRIPVALAWKSQDLFDNRSGLYAGHLGFGTPAGHKAALAEADLIIAAGTRLGDVASLGFTFPAAPVPKQRLVHIYPDSRPIGRVVRTDLGIVAEPAPLLEALSHRARVASSAREAWISSVHGFIKGFMAFTSPNPPDGVDYGTVIEALWTHAPEDAVITTDAGNISTWVHRHWPMTPKNTLIGAVAGAMGYGVPTAVSASLAAPHRMAITVVGDGGILMTGQELATALQFGAKPKIIISDNGIYGTIRLHQEREYPGRVSGTDLHNPDFTAWAKSFGAHVVRIEKGDNVGAKVKEALAHDGASVVHVKSSRIALSSNVTMKN